jgi:hypothetical protein
VAKLFDPTVSCGERECYGSDEVGAVGSSDGGVRLGRPLRKGTIDLGGVVKARGLQVRKYSDFKTAGGWKSTDSKEAIRDYSGRGVVRGLTFAKTDQVAR